MSLHITVLDRLFEVARQLEATACYAVLVDDGHLNWSDPIHVKRDEDASASPRSTIMMFQELASKVKLTGSAFELSPGKHCLILPVPFKGKRVALGCLVVRADDRLAHFMLRLAKLLLQRDDYFSEGVCGAAGDE